MSAWYVFSVVGFYPICPGRPEYLRGKQLVKSVKIRGKAVNENSDDKFIPYKDLV